MTVRYLINFNTANLEHIQTDVIVVGSGVAGLFAALEISKQFDVALLAKADLKESATWYAQGGVATAVSSEDSPQFHLKDTLDAGAGLCDLDAVGVLVNEAADRIGDLIALGTKFDWQGNEIGLSREGGHRLARVLHAGDATGSEIESSLIHAANTWKSIQVYERRFAVDILLYEGSCAGILAYDEVSNQAVVHNAKAVIIATGGMGQLFAVTTSPVVCTGDGIAMAYRAGATLTDLEFMQFHPTALDVESMPRFLITEALRGEGAYLRDCNGERFMIGKHPLAELAPRDVVTREMVRVMNKCRNLPIYLDARHIPEEILNSKYPTVWSHLEANGKNLAKDLIPVRPSAHYTIGGIKTDFNGRTSIPNLYATGEAACTGVHGANRLASNSLLEGLVFSKRIASNVISNLAEREEERCIHVKEQSTQYRSTCALNPAQERKWLQRLMTSNVGVVRSNEGLNHALDQLKNKSHILDCEGRSTEIYELQNMFMLAKLVAKAALIREESRGVHYREDFPEPREEWLKHIDIQAKEGVQVV